MKQLLELHVKSAEGKKNMFQDTITNSVFLLHLHF